MKSIPLLSIIKPKERDNNCLLAICIHHKSIYEIELSAYIRLPSRKVFLLPSGSKRFQRLAFRIEL